MQVRRLAWVGTRTDHVEGMTSFLRDVLGLRLVDAREELTVFQLPDGSKVEVFPTSEKGHFTTGPVVEFLVDDVVAATEQLSAAGVNILEGPIEWPGEDDVAWVHFRAPDGNVYGLTQGRDLEPPNE
jgi:catechol 2,3-dioxygenase-like lactoylglutathione lyase family enzyme